MLLKNGDSIGIVDGKNFNSSIYRTVCSSPSDGCSSYNNGGTYYANNPSGMSNWNQPSEYRGSTLQQAMVAAANTFPEKEQSVIVARTLAENLANQKFWALSTGEWNQLTGQSARAYGNTSWGLRTPVHATGIYSSYSDGSNTFGNTLGNTSYAFRPAFYLNLKSVLFASTVDTGTTGSGWTDAVILTTGKLEGADTIKYTFFDVYDANSNPDGIKTPIFTLKSNFDFDFSDASHDEGLFVSGLISNLYAKFAQPDEDGKDAFQLLKGLEDMGLANGIYTLRIFGEKIENLSSGFVGNPVVFEANVFNGTINDLTLLSDVPFGLDGGEIHLENGMDYTETWTLDADDGTIVVRENESATISGEIVGTGDLTKDGDGKLTLSGTNRYEGDTTIAQGTLEVTGTLGKGYYEGDIENNDRLIFDQNLNQTLAGTISGNGHLTKDGDGTLTLTGESTYAGDTTVSQGTLTLAGKLENSKVSVDPNAIFTLYGTAGQEVSLSSESTMNVHPGSAIGGDLTTAENTHLTFHLPHGLVNGDTMLTVAGTATIADSTVSLNFSGKAPKLNIGDRIVLIDATSIDGLPYSTPMARTWGFLDYDFGLVIDEEKSDLLALLRNITANPRTKAFSEGHLAGLALLTGAVDLAEKSLPLAAELARAAPGFQGFGSLSGGSLRYQTGSHIDLNATHLIVGVAAGGALSQHHATLGAFFEQGEGDDDTTNGPPRVKGQGDTDYAGLGLLSRLDLAETPAGQLYLEAIVRGGRVKTDFHAPDLGARFKSRSAYYGATLSVGYLWKPNEDTGIDLYAKYLWTRERADRARLSTGETIEFSAINSERLRLGGKVSRTLNEAGNIKAYVGLAREEELDGKARAKIQGYKIHAPTLKGSSGIAELGLSITPAPTSPLTLDIGLQSYTGKREGIMGSLKVNYRF